MAFDARHFIGPFNPGEAPFAIRLVAVRPPEGDAQGQGTVLLKAVSLLVIPWWWEDGYVQLQALCKLIGERGRFCGILTQVHDTLQTAQGWAAELHHLVTPGSEARLLHLAEVAAASPAMPVPPGRDGTSVVAAPAPPPSPPDPGTIRRRAGDAGAADGFTVRVLLRLRSGHSLDAALAEGDELPLSEGPAMTPSARPTAVVPAAPIEPTVLAAPRASAHERGFVTVRMQGGDPAVPTTDVETLLAQLLGTSPKG